MYTEAHLYVCVYSYYNNFENFYTDMSHHLIFLLSLSHFFFSAFYKDEPMTANLFSSSGVTVMKNSSPSNANPLSSVLPPDVKLATTPPAAGPMVTEGPAKMRKPTISTEFSAQGDSPRKQRSTGEVVAATISSNTTPTGGKVWRALRHTLTSDCFKSIIH